MRDVLCERPLTSILEKLTASVENMLVTSMVQRWKLVLYQRSTSLSFRLSADSWSEVGIQRWIDVSPIVNFCLGYNIFPANRTLTNHL